MRDRSTHTGTQLAATISNFAATVITAALTGLSTATGGVITAADTVLSALGKLQKQITDLTTTVRGKLGATAQAVDSAKLGGASMDQTGTAGTVTQRDGAGDITTRLYRSTYATGADAVTSFVGRASSDGTGDNYRPPQSIAQTKALLGVGTMANRSVTISAAAPSGGVDGDFWVQP
ncbi:hypothetical protein NKI88_30825 [Mesorhizobium sp. M0317]|uniref:hypothetical protein n=1 Tax=unclassified Mesorhizobium TaxID=325217 RepID=UPI00333536CC